MRRQTFRYALAVIAFISGCNLISCIPIYGAVPAYGAPVPTQPGDPTVTLTDFSYTPASPVALGSGIVFTATQSKETSFYAFHTIDVTIGETDHLVPGYPGGVITVALLDDGGLYDEVPDDLIYSGAVEWRTHYGEVEGLPVFAKLTWWDDTPDVIFTGEPLTVVEGTEP